ncbi:MAG: AAA family ATPase [Actinobacteria bacterium]|nr:AAA family ATPase [Actinomycetota bacterium]
MINWDYYYRGKDWAPHLERKVGEKIQDPAYFGPTHVKLMDRNVGFVQPYTVISAVMDRAVQDALWNAEVYKDKERPGIFVVQPRDGGSGNHYMRISRYDESGGYLRVSHRCDKFGGLPKGKPVACNHIPVAVCALEIAEHRRTSIGALAKAVAVSCQPGQVYEGNREKAYIRLMDELYYVMRYTLKMDDRLVIEKDRARKKTFELCSGKRVITGEKKSGGYSRRENALKKKAAADLAKCRISRTLTPEEKEWVPNGVFYVEQDGEEGLATKVVYAKDPLLIVGPAGVGKSRLARKVFERLGLPALVISASSDRSLYSPMSSIVIECGETREVPAKVLSAAKCGYGLIIEEITSLKPDRALFLNSILQARELDLGTGTFKLHEDCRIIGTCDEGDEFIGSHGIDHRIRDFFVPLYLGYPDRRIEADIVATESGFAETVLIEKMVEVAARVRRLYSHGEMYKPLTTRDLIRWAKYSDHSCVVHIAKKTVIPGVAYGKKERLMLADLIEEVFFTGQS